MSVAEYYIMKPKVDFCFKELMKDSYVRCGFMAALINCPPEEIDETTLLPTELGKKNEDDKLGILDVRVLLKDGTQIDIEMQVAPYLHWPERSIFYLSKMMLEQIHKGDSYDVMPKCIHVGILDFTLFPDTKEYSSCFHFREDTRNTLYTDKMEIHILELPKLKKNEYPDTALLDWAKFFDAEEKEEFEEVADKSEYINHAYEELQNLSANQAKRLKYEAREKALKDHISFLKESREQGLEEGRREGSLQLLISQVIKKVKKGQEERQIIEALEEEPELVRKIYDIIKDNPQCSEEDIYRKVV